MESFSVCPYMCSWAITSILPLMIMEIFPFQHGRFWDPQRTPLSLPKHITANGQRSQLKGEFNGISWYEMLLMLSFSVGLHCIVPVALKHRLYTVLNQSLTPEVSFSHRQDHCLTCFIHFNLHLTVLSLYSCSFICQIGFSDLFPSTKTSWSNIPELFSGFWWSNVECSTTGTVLCLWIVSIHLFSFGPK